MAPVQPPQHRPLTLNLEAFDDEEVAAGAEHSLIASVAGETARMSVPHPPPAHAVVSKGVSSGFAVGGIGAAILALDKVLRDHGETLETLTEAGPLAGALLQNWPLLLLGAFVWRAAATRWQEYNTRQSDRDRLTARDRRATIKVLRLVATEIGDLRSDLATVRDLATTTDVRARDETAKLREHVDTALGQMRDRIDRIVHVEARRP